MGTKRGEYGQEFLLLSHLPKPLMCFLTSMQGCSHRCQNAFVSFCYEEHFRRSLLSSHIIVNSKLFLFLSTFIQRLLGQKWIFFNFGNLLSVHRELAVDVCK